MAAWIGVIDKRVVRFLGILAVTAAALVLGYIGLHQYLARDAHGDFGRSWADIVFYDLQLFLFASAPTQGAGPFPAALAIARFFAPASTALATVETLRLILGDQLRVLAAASASGHAVVTGEGPVALEIARGLRGRYRKVVLVSGDQATLAQGRRYRLLDVFGDPADAETLRRAGLRRASVLYACSDLGTTTAATALRARELARAAGSPLACYAQVRDGGLYAALRARRIGAAGDRRIRLDFFSMADTAARVLLDRYPVVSDGEPVPARIIGFGPLGRAVLREAARRRPPGGQKVPVAVQGAAEDEIAAFAEEFPAVGRNCALTREGPDRSAPAGVRLVFVCLPGNEEALSTGLAVAATLANDPARVIICLGTPSPFGPVLLSEKSGLLDNKKELLTVFGVVEEACVPDVIREDLVNQLARAIHRAYMANCAARGDTPQVNKSMRPWEELPDDLKDANLQQAEDIGVKLRAIDSEVVPESASAVPDFSFSDKEVEILARMEHRRWVQERRAKGYVYGPVREGREHPDLVDWDSLSDRAKEKDRDHVREIPAILGDAGFRIIRLRPR